jgi:Flp pilus assembly protein TadD
LGISALRKLSGLPMSGCVRVLRAFMVAAALVLTIGLGGCGLDGTLSLEKLKLPPPPTETPLPTATVEQPANIQYYPSDEPLRLALEHFNRGHYGIAEKYFRDAVEKAPRDVTAWIGLAATYDRIARFDLADRAYANAIKLAGNTIAILNNQGYSYMLRGDYVAARKKFLLAYRREPNNPTVLNNLKLLDGSVKSVQRPDGDVAPQ